MDVKNLDGYVATILDIDVAFIVKDNLKNEEDIEGGAYAFFDKDNSRIVFGAEECEELADNDLKRVIRHEMIHAYMYHSSFQPDCYPVDEEFVTEWIAQMFPRMAANFEKAYQALKANPAFTPAPKKTTK